MSKEEKEEGEELVSEGRTVEKGEGKGRKWLG